MLETNLLINGILENESKFLMDLSFILIDCILKKFKVCKDRANVKIDFLSKESNERLLEYDERLNCAIKSIGMKENIISKMEHEIHLLKTELRYNQLSLDQTKEALSLCQCELKSTSTDLEKYFMVSENDRKSIHLAYLEMREKAVQESLKCNKYETERSLLKSDKENCEFKLQKNQIKLEKTLHELKATKSSFERNIVNEEAQKHQMQYLTLLKQSR